MARFFLRPSCICKQIGIADSYIRRHVLNGVEYIVRYDYHSINVPKSRVENTTVIRFIPLPSKTNQFQNPTVVKKTLSTNTYVGKLIIVAAMIVLVELLLTAVYIDT